jgi:hypothetical protein
LPDHWRIFATRKSPPGDFVLEQFFTFHCLGPHRSAGNACMAADGEVALEISGVLAHCSVHVRNRAHRRNDSCCERSP